MALRTKSVWVSWRESMKRWEVGFYWEGQKCRYYSWTFQGRRFSFTRENRAIADEFAGHVRSKMRPNKQNIVTFDPAMLNDGKRKSAYSFDRYATAWLEVHREAVKTGDRSTEYIGQIAQKGSGLCSDNGYIEDEINKTLTELALEMSKLLTAKQSFWEGDIRDGIYVFALPIDEPTTEIGFIWKQDNNGQTFVLSPRELPWLNKHQIME